MNAVRKQPARRRRGQGGTGMVARRLASIAPVVSRVVVEPPGDPVTPLDGWPEAPPAGTRCVAYVSVGSDDVPFSRSVEQQAAIRAYVTAHGLDVIDLACDIVSGDDDGERTGLEALVRGAPALGATHLIVQDRSRIATRPASGTAGGGGGFADAAVGNAVGETANEPPWLAGMVLIEAEPVHLFRGYRETVLKPPMAWPRRQLSTRVDSRRISRMVTGQEAN
ncbi:MAG: hypothetical protein NTX54_09720 [Chloroflexi bacterium]|nr:hypothetical protein [Chloroflexota bacterium]